MTLQRPAALVALSGLLAGAAAAQNLFREPPPPMPADSSGRPDQYAEARAASLTFIEPPRPRTFEINQLVTIIIDETSSQSSKQKIDTKKDASLQASIDKFPDLASLLEMRLETNPRQPIAEADLSAKGKYKGEGTYTRSDSFRAKITATVIDVKPNGNLVLEAKKIRQTDREVQTIVLSGACRAEDVTASNTILSSQLADLTVSQQNTGEVKDAGSKGFLTRIFSAIFNF